MGVNKETHWKLMWLQVWLAKFQLHKSFCSLRPCKPPKRYIQSWCVTAEW